MGKSRASADPNKPNLERRGATGSPSLVLLNYWDIASPAFSYRSTPTRPPNVGFQAWDCSTWPCGREGELNPGAAMCDKKGRGSQNHLQNGLFRALHEILQIPEVLLLLSFQFFCLTPSKSLSRNTNYL